MDTSERGGLSTGDEAERSARKTTIHNAIPIDLVGAIHREYEARLFDHYGRPVYWDGADPAVASSPLQLE